MISQEARDPQQPCGAPEGSPVLRGNLAGLPPAADDIVMLPIRHWVTACVSWPGSVPGPGIQKGWGTDHVLTDSQIHEERKCKGLISILQRKALKGVTRATSWALTGRVSISRCIRNLTRAQRISMWYTGSLREPNVVGRRQGLGSEGIEGPEQVLS